MARSHRWAHLDGAQGDTEQRRESYRAYDERAAQAATQRSAKNSASVASSAGKQGAAVRQSRPFAVFDIDGTLIRWQLYHALADEMAKRGQLDAKEFEKVRQARMTWKKRAHESSFSDYEMALVNLIDRTLPSIREADLVSACQHVIDEYKDQVYTYTRDLIQELSSKNYLLFAISASQSQLVALIAEYYGFDDYGGSEYEVKGGYFTGSKKLLKSTAKPEFLKALVQKHQASWQKSVGVGDSEGDIPMLSAVEQPSAFNPDKKLFEHAKQQGWKIVVERKNMVYELEPKDESYRLIS